MLSSWVARRNYLLAVIVAGAASYIGWIASLGLSRGFGILDEASYAANIEIASNPRNLESILASPAISLSPVLIARLVPSGATYAEIKVWQLVYRAVATLCFLAALLGYVRRFYPSMLGDARAVLASVALLAIPLCGSIGLQVFSYNHLTEFLVLLTISGLLYYFASSNIAAAMAVGYFCSFLLLAKPTALVLLGPAIVVWTIAMVGATRFWTNFLPYSIVGCLLAIITMHYLVLDIPRIYNFFAIRLTHPPKTHGADQVFGYMVRTFLRDGRGAILLMLLVGVSIVILPKLRRIFRGRQSMEGSDTTTGYVVAWFLLIVGLVLLHRQDLPVLFATYYYAGHLLGILVLQMVPAVLGLAKLQERFGRLASILFLLPLVCAFGSNNGFSQVSVYLTSWLLLLFLIPLAYNEISRKTGLAIMLMLLQLATLAYCTKYFRFYFARHPYDQVETLFGQDIQLPGIAKLAGTRVDPDTADLLEKIKDTMSLHNKTRVLPLFDMPGLAYAFSDAAYLIPDSWISHDFHFDPNYLESHLNHIDSQTMHRTLIIRNFASVNALRTELRPVLARFYTKFRTTQLGSFFSRRLGRTIYLEGVAGD